MKIFSQILIACTLMQAIQTIRPGAEWSLQGNTYAGLNWIDKTQSKPTQSEITTALSSCQTTTDGQLLSDVRANASAAIVSGSASELQRAILLTILDQVNTIRASLPTPLSAITPAQVKAAVQAKINSGAAD